MKIYFGVDISCHEVPSERSNNQLIKLLFSDETVMPLDVIFKVAAQKDNENKVRSGYLLA